MKTLLLRISLIALSATPARAAGLNLGWDDCTGGATYSLTKTFACDTNIGVSTLVGSFVAPAGLDSMDASEVVIDLETAGTVLPDWWKLGTTRCRPTSLSLDVDFTTGPFTCYDYWQGAAVGGTAEDPPGSFNRARIKAVFALPPGDRRITPVPEGAHVYSFKLNINYAKTVGLGSCAGCSVEACIVFQSLLIDQPPPLVSPVLYNADTVRHVIWEGWSNPDPNHACPASVVPVKQRTWGSIKSLYR